MGGLPSRLEDAQGNVVPDPIAVEQIATMLMQYEEVIVVDKGNENTNNMIYLKNVANNVGSLVRNKDSEWQKRLQMEIGIEVNLYIEKVHKNLPIEKSDLFFVAPNYAWLSASRTIIAATPIDELTGRISAINQAGLVADLVKAVGAGSVAYVLTEYPSYFYDDVASKITGDVRGDRNYVDYFRAPQQGRLSAIEQLYKDNLMIDHEMNVTVLRPAGWDSKEDIPLSFKVRPEYEENMQFRSRFLKYTTVNNNKADAVVLHGYATTVFCVELRPEKRGSGICDNHNPRL
jgi:hypothetical protein